MTLSRRGLAIMVAALAGLGGAGTALWHRRLAPPVLPEDFWTLRFARPDGGELHFAVLRGGPLLLNFWATWCPPCVEELPLLDRFQREQQAHGWRVVGLAVDNAAPVREFLSRHPLGITIGLASADGLALARALGNSQGGLPFTAIFDASGSLRARKLGAVTPAELRGWAAGLG